MFSYTVLCDFLFYGFHFCPAVFVAWTPVCPHETCFVSTYGLSGAQGTGRNFFLEGKFDLLWLGQTVWAKEAMWAMEAVWTFTKCVAK